jgi:hypothetical protein
VKCFIIEGDFFVNASFYLGKNFKFYGFFFFEGGGLRVELKKKIKKKIF